jgi:sugar transferase EpsL
MSESFYRRRGKRIFDIVVGSVLLVLSIPLLGVVAAAVRVFIGRPIFFVQERPGAHARTFRLVKFRTMTDARGADGRLLPDGERLGRFGRLLRRSSLDELPELLNVLTGDMSLVGPRPLLIEYLPRYTAQQRRRHDVRPGLTGWAEVNGRNALSWEDRFQLDVWYVDHIALGLDLTIMAKTLVAVLAGSGVREPGHATKNKFRGSAGSQ